MKSIWNRFIGPTPHASVEKPILRVGLSIDSDHTDESDLEINGSLPLWTSTVSPISPVHLTNPSTPYDSSDQDTLPRRKAALSLDSQDGREQNSLSQAQQFLSLPLLNSNEGKYDDCHNERHPIQLHKRHDYRDDYDFNKTTFFSLEQQKENRQNHVVISTRLFKLLLVAMSLSMIGFSFHRTVYNEILEQPNPEFFKTIDSPDYYMLEPSSQHSVREASSSSFPQVASTRHRSNNIALARTQDSRPVFEGRSMSASYVDIEEEETTWVPWIAGVGFLLVLVETGVKGYKQSKSRRL